MNTIESQRALVEVQQFLEERWEVQQSNEFTFQFTYVANGGIPMACVAWVNPQLEAFFFRVVLQLPVEANLRPTMAELITRVNYPLPVGNFALDYETGDLRFKSGVYFGGASLSRPLIRNAVESSLEFVDLHIMRIVKLMMGQSLEEALVTDVENPAGDNSRPPFEAFIPGYLRSLFIAVGLEDVTNDEISAFQAHLEKSFGSQYTFGGYNGFPKQSLNEPAMRAAYERGTLRFSASQSGMAVVQSYRQEILRRRAATD